jgi:hypothetical protein
MIEAAISLILRRRKYIMLRNLFILLTAMFMGLVYYKFSISKSKDAQNMAFFMKITFLVLSLILSFARQEFILIGDLAFGGRTPVMVLVLIEIADAFIDRKNNSTQVNKKKRSTSSMEMRRRK